ncbi:hypothetical protein I5G63_gp094 [Mycobacterium phage Imvubu]|uniref:Uncharacterized protein n=1 Tax=Mycobacterium phage Imvubu TaxID=2686233 RepID=A0A6B9LJ00_9CAUD|nr:hypothetical protein I5G63_gp094 [Mycobacterium phage Imvubu]QHB37834.1 hypothetical protein PBI_IMVUBU_94 [Mycobacterium phage Imvubu]
MSLGVLVLIGLVLVLLGDRWGSSFLTEMGAILVVAPFLALPVGWLMGTL